jgi:hypothetical protein
MACVGVAPSLRTLSTPLRSSVPSGRSVRSSLSIASCARRGAATPTLDRTAVTSSRRRAAVLPGTHRGLNGDAVRRVGLHTELWPGLIPEARRKVGRRHHRQTRDALAEHEARDIRSGQLQRHHHRAARATVAHRLRVGRTDPECAACEKQGQAKGRPKARRGHHSAGEMQHGLRDGAAREHRARRQQSVFTDWSGCS